MKARQWRDKREVAEIGLDPASAIKQELRMASRLNWSSKLDDEVGRKDGKKERVEMGR